MLVFCPLTTRTQLFSKIVRADYLPVDRTLYSERLSNLVDHLLMPDPNIRPKIDMVRMYVCAVCERT